MQSSRYRVAPAPPPGTSAAPALATANDSDDEGEDLMPASSALDGYLKNVAEERQLNSAATKVQSHYRKHLALKLSTEK